MAGSGVVVSLIAGPVLMVAGICILVFIDAFTEWNARNADRVAGSTAGNAIRARGRRSYRLVGIGVIVLGIFVLGMALSRLW